MLEFKDTSNFLHIVNIEKVTHVSFHPISDKEDIRLSIHKQDNHVLAVVVSCATSEYIREKLVKHGEIEHG